MRKIIIKLRITSNQCPECKEGHLRFKVRKNYPFGRKSKPVRSEWKICKKCGYSKLHHGK